MRAGLTVVSVGAAAAAVLLIGPRSVRSRTRAGLAPPPGGARLAERRHRTVSTMLAAALPVGAAWALLDGPTLVLALLGVLAGFAALRLVRDLRRDAAAAQRRARVVEFAEALVGDLRAGRPPLAALERAARGWPEARPVAAAALLGADVPTAFEVLGRSPGASAAARLGGAWAVSSGTGAGLARAVEQVLETARVEQATLRRVRAELASARATARLVAALPVLVLAGAQGLGGRPWHFLLGTGPGLVCLAAGSGLVWAGLTWIERIGRAATEGPR